MTGEQGTKRPGHFPPTQPVKRSKPNYENGDRYCAECGRLIFGQAKNKLEKCPFASCKKPIFLRSPDWVNGLAKCVTCDANINEAMLHCELCGRPNPRGFERRERLERAERMATEAKLKARINELEKISATKSMELEEKLAKINDLQAVVDSQEKEIEVVRLRGLDLSNDFHNGVENVKLDNEIRDEINKMIE